MAVENSSAQIEKPEDLGKTEEAKVAFWLAEVKASEKPYVNWMQEGDAISSRYRDDRKVTTRYNRKTRKFNILWSNTNIMQTTIFKSVGKPVIERRHKDRDPVARAAAQILERTLKYLLEEFDPTYEINRAVQERLLPGRGVCRVVYEPTFGEVLTDEDGEEVTEENGEPLEEVIWEDCYIDHVYWKDFSTNDARKWSDVRWCKFNVNMTLAKLEKRFGKELAAKIPLTGTDKDATDNDEAGPADSTLKTARVWEIWSEAERKVYWICPDYSVKPLDVVDDPLKLKNFWPTPRPLFATTTTRDMVPTPDYHLYLDQAQQLDELTNRIAILTKALKVVGVYPGEDNAAIRRLFEGNSNKLIPIAEWGKYIESGGVANMIQWVPIKEVAMTIRELQARSDAIKQDIFEITGISDVVRGVTDPSETLGAQQLKGQFASARIETIQNDIKRYIKELFDIMAEVVAENFAPDTLWSMSGFEQLGMITDEIVDVDAQAQQGQVQQDPQQAQQAQLQQQSPEGQQQQGQPQQQQQSPEEQRQQQVQLFEQAVQLLRDDSFRAFRLSVESEATLAFDEQKERENRTQFLTAMSAFLQEAIPAATQTPEMADLLLEMASFTMRGFRIGRDMEAAFEKAADLLRKKAAAALKNPPQDPAAMEAQAKTQLDQMQMQIKGQELQIKGQEIEIKRMTAQSKAQNDAQKNQIAGMKVQGELANDQASLQLQNDIMRLDNQIEERKLELEQQGIFIDEGDLDRKIKADALEFLLSIEAGQEADLEGDF